MGFASLQSLWAFYIGILAETSSPFPRERGYFAGATAPRPCRGLRPKARMLWLLAKSYKQGCFCQLNQAVMHGRIKTAAQSRCTMQRHKQLTLQRCKTNRASNAKHPFLTTIEVFRQTEAAMLKSRLLLFSVLIRQQSPGDDFGQRPGLCYSIKAIQKLTSPRSFR